MTKNGTIISDKSRVRIHLIVFMACLTMFLLVLSTAFATPTVNEALSYCESLLGTKVGSGQCVAFIQAYYSYLGASPVSGNACDYATNSLPSGWSRVKGGVPQAGDILVYAGAKYGHVAIYAGGTVSYHQNMAGQWVEKKTSWSYDNSWYSTAESGTKYYWGYIRPNWPAPVNHNPIMDVNSLESTSAGKIYIRGWTYDPDDTSKSLDIHVYNGTTFLGSTTANVYRPDVNQNEYYYGCGDYHGFEAFINTTLTGTKDIQIYAINVGEGQHTGYSKTISIAEDTTKPTISSVTINTITKTSFWVSINVTDNVIVAKVRVPVWRASLGGSSATWFDAGQYNEKTWICQVTRGTEEQKYYGHVYAYDLKGNETSVGTIVHSNLVVTFNANGGSCSTSSKEIAAAWFNATAFQTYGTLPTPTRTGYSFDGWYTAASGGTKITSTSSVSNQDNHTLYAHWTANKYTISYDANGGTGAPGSQTKTHDVTLTLSSGKPSMDGYRFICWNTMKDGTGTNYNPNDSFTTNAATTLYAQWAKNTYTVSYDANGGTGAPDSQTKTHDVALTISTTVPSRDGYRFVSWNTSKDGTGTSYHPGDSFATNQNVTLYAQWDAITYTVSYDANGGANAPDSQVKYALVNLPLTTTEPTRPGHLFEGWSLTADATRVDYLPGDIFTTDADTTLYAVWSAPDFILPAALTDIEAGAFAGGVFTYVVLPEGTKRVESRAFADCPNLRHIYIPAGAYIAEDAFEGVPDGLTIHGKLNSIAYYYAQAHGYHFVAE